MLRPRRMSPPHARQYAPVRISASPRPARSGI